MKKHQYQTQQAITCSKLTTETPCEICEIRTRCEICSKLSIKTQERRYCHRSGIFIANFEHTSHLALVFLLLILNR